jgi:hypothetical protein
MKLSLYQLLPILFICLSQMVLAATDIAPMSWTMRSDWIDVTDSPYNAAGDGVIDDTAALQDALDDAYAVVDGKSVVYIPGGTYRITSSLEWQGSGLTLIGDGRDTVIQWDGADSGTMLLSTGVTRTRFIGMVWQGSPDGSLTHANRAAYGIDHHPTTAYESRIRHENEAFYNFTTAGIRSYGGGGSEMLDDPTAETMVWNCLFQNCAIGIWNGSHAFNNYQWVIEGCHFIDNETAINTPKGKSMIYNCRFERSSVVDISTSAGLSQRVRRCVSVGSNYFFNVDWGTSTGSNVIEDCHVDSWTNSNGALHFAAQGPMQVTDCVFTNPPNGNAPIYMSNSYNPSRLLVGGNYCAEIATLNNVPGNCTVVELPLGARGNSVPSADLQFLKATWPADSTNILDVTLPPYNAAIGDMSVDSSSAIQDAIDDAIAANNGSIVYIPHGIYRIDSTLSVSGGNYVIEGSGWKSRLLWYGTAGDTIMEVISAQGVELRQFNLMQTSGNESANPPVPADTTTRALKISGSGTTALLMDGVYSKQFPSNNPNSAPSSNATSPGALLQNLPTSAMITMVHHETPLTIEDCGRATIFCKYFLGGQIRVNGSNYAKSGFLGVLACQAGNLKDSSGWDITIDDNQDLVIADWYVEQAYNHLKLSGGSGSGSGRVSISGIKQQSFFERTVLEVDDYEGTLLYTGQSFTGASSLQPVNQTGSSLANLIFASCTWSDEVPDFDFDSGGNLIQLNNTYKDDSGAYSYPSNVTPNNWEQVTAEGFDYFRELAWYDFVLNYGVGNFLLNSTVELDEANSSPTSTMGYQPNDWQSNNEIMESDNTRNVTVVNEGSPFGLGDHSILFTDTTTSSGSRLELVQYFGPLELTENDAAVLKFDFRLNSSALNNDVWIRPFAGAESACAIHLMSNGTTGSISASGMSAVSVSLDTWYHVEVALEAPAVGAATGTLSLTEWTASGAGAMTSYSVTSFGSPQTSGFNRLFMSQVSGGDSTSLLFDNVQFTIGDPVLYVDNFLSNSTIESDAANPSPTTTMGYQPADWTVDNALQVEGNTRNVTVDAEGSSFDGSYQSILFTDTTTSGGSRLVMYQYLSPLELTANDGLVLKFDFRLNSSALDNDVWIRPFAGATSGCGIHLLSDGSTGSISAGGMSTVTLSLDTWYRVEVALGAPAMGASTGLLYLTEWTDSGAGATTSYSLNSFGSPKSSAFNRIYVNQVSPATSTSIHFDNIQSIIGNPLL